MSKQLLYVKNPENPTGPLILVLRGWLGSKLFPKYMATRGECRTFKELNRYVRTLQPKR